MGCFSLTWLQQLLVWLIVIAAIYALIKLLLPFALAQLGTAGSVISQALHIVLWAIIAIVVVYIVFALIACLMHSAGLPLLPHR